MRDKTGRVLVRDFGLAPHSRRRRHDPDRRTGRHHGLHVAEQALGKELDQRSDVFALGLIFYELLTGKMPYKADSVVASLLKRNAGKGRPCIEPRCLDTRTT